MLGFCINLFLLLLLLLLFPHLLLPLLVLSCHLQRVFISNFLKHQNNRWRSWCHASPTSSSFHPSSQGLNMLFVSEMKQTLSDSRRFTRRNLSSTSWCCHVIGQPSSLFSPLSSPLNHSTAVSHSILDFNLEVDFNLNRRQV
eukprot:Lithocolla_globosa_v1_NODE_7249_length_972_cov_4.785169.p2 type:complete len:142 gc:universal NODE_7249_length_972_cov_4.785169:506-931(+)